MTTGPDPLEQPELDFDKLPKWARAAFEKVVAAGTPSAAARTPKDLAGGPAWPSLLRAALVSSFLPRQLAAGDSVSLKDISADILGFSERTTGPEGTRWMLTPDARRSILGAASPGDVSEAIAWLAERKSFTDPVSVALRAQVSGAVPMEGRSLPELEAQRLAAVWMGDKRHKDAPTQEELDRQVARRRLLEPVHHMLGVVKYDGTPIDLGKIPFFGRDTELNLLNDYAGVVSSRGAVANLLSGLRRSVLGPGPPMVVYGGGGVGKTTLIARFLVEHEQQAQSKFPFVYLDFDRAAISARRPALLLAEMCAQVAVQFPALHPTLERLRDQARALSASLEESVDATDRELATLDRVGVLLDEFRRIVDGHMAELESRLEFARPFLLVLDTFEVVQHAIVSNACIERFIRKLSPSKDDDGRGWARLRLIVSGRKRPARFLNGFKEIRLASLDESSAMAMLQRLAHDAGRKLDARLARELLRLVKEIDRKNDAALSPLRIQLIGEIFARDTDTDSDAVARRLITELKDTSRTGTVRRKLIEGVLMRRILGHIADARVKALADPGLVVRRITPEVIRKVMAPGTPSPNSEPDDLAADDPKADAPQFDPWTITDEEAESIFEACKAEARLFDEDGGALRHRQDVREDMLPLIQARRPNRFRRLHQLAYTHFEERAATDPTDHVALAEAIYHALWLGIDLRIIDRFWPDAPDFDPRLAAAEFDELPAAHAYVRARAGEPLDEAAVAALPQRLATQWAVARGSRWLDEGDANVLVRQARTATGESFERLDGHEDTAAVTARLLYRAGEWPDSVALIRRQLRAGQTGGLMMLSSLAQRGPRSDIPGLPGLFRLSDSLSLLLTWASMTARLGAADHTPLELAARIAAHDDLNLDDFMRIELLAYAVLGARTTDVAALRDPGLAARLTASARHAAPSMWRQRARTLRLVILGANDDVGELTAQYLRYGGAAVPDDAVLAEAGYATALALHRTGEQAQGAEAIDMAVSLASSPQLRPKLRALWSDHLGRVMDVVRKDEELQHKMRRIILHDHHDWSRPLGHALSRAMADEKIRISIAARLQSDDEGIRASDEDDGPAIVRRVLARGTLSMLTGTILEIAQTLGIEPRTGDFPETVFDFAAALRAWHEANWRALNETQNGRTAPNERSA